MFHAFGDVVGAVLTLPCIMSLMVSVTLGLGSGDMSRVAMVVVVVVGMVGQVVEMVELGRQGPGGEGVTRVEGTEGLHGATSQPGGGGVRGQGVAAVYSARRCRKRAHVLHFARVG